MTDKKTLSIKRIIASIVLLALVVAGIAFGVRHNTITSNQDKTKLQAVATYYPLYDFARNIGGDKVQVTNETPAGAEPHDYEPSPKALANAKKAQVFIYNGGHMEPWTEGFLNDYKNIAVKASQGVHLMAAADDKYSETQVQDPHFWLDPVLVRQIVKNIQEGFIKADPANKGYYVQNANAYIAKLDQLDTDYRQGLATCQLRSVISSHDAFSYLAKRYNFEVTSIAGITPEEEPSAAKMAEISQLIKDKGIKYIFFESLVSPRLADTIATETNAKTLVFDPIEGLNNEDQKQGQDYLSVQRENLANLRTALACQ